MDLDAPTVLGYLSTAFSNIFFMSQVEFIAHCKTLTLLFYTKATMPVDQMSQMIDVLEAAMLTYQISILPAAAATESGVQQDPNSETPEYKKIMAHLVDVAGRRVCTWYDDIELQREFASTICHPV